MLLPLGLNITKNRLRLPDLHHTLSKDEVRAAGSGLVEPHEAVAADWQHVKLAHLLNVCVPEGDRAALPRPRHADR